MTAQKFGCDELDNKTLQFVAKKFFLICDSEEIHALDAKAFEKVARCQRLSVRTKSMFFTQSQVG